MTPVSEAFVIGFGFGLLAAGVLVRLYGLTRIVDHRQNGGHGGPQPG